MKCNTIAAPPVGLCALPYSGGDVATAVHFHGTESPSAYDGGPDEWFTNNNNPGFVPAKQGPAYVTNNFVYENQQEPGEMDCPVLESSCEVRNTFHCAPKAEA